MNTARQTILNYCLDCCIDKRYVTINSLVRFWLAYQHTIRSVVLFAALVLVGGPVLWLLSDLTAASIVITNLLFYATLTGANWAHLGRKHRKLAQCLAKLGQTNGALHRQEQFNNYAKTIGLCVERRNIAEKREGWRD